MECPQCGFDNREGAKFCKKCGNKLETTCPSCGHPYEPDSMFCDECGHNLSIPSEPVPREPTVDEKFAKIQKYLPTGLAEKILSQRDKIEGERKQVTVMFCDMADFTPLGSLFGVLRKAKRLGICATMVCPAFWWAGKEDRSFVVRQIHRRSDSRRPNQTGRRKRSWKAKILATACR